MTILSESFEGRTTGTISVLWSPNAPPSVSVITVKSHPYYRPGHADYAFDAKYGFRDCKGRRPRVPPAELVGRVAAEPLPLLY